jgi:hypothetical protein
MQRCLSRADQFLVAIVGECCLTALFKRTPAAGNLKNAKDPVVKLTASGNLFVITTVSSTVPIGRLGSESM